MSRLSTAAVLTVCLLLEHSTVSTNLTTDKQQYVDKEIITVSFRHPTDSPPSARDWITITPSGLITLVREFICDDTEPCNITSEAVRETGLVPPNIPWKYVCGQTDPCNKTIEEGSVEFHSNSLGEGDFEATYFADDGFTKLAEPVSFNVNITCASATVDVINITHTLPVSGNELSKIAFGSCFMPHKQVSDSLWKHMRQTYSPDLWMWIGDNMYADGRNMNAKRMAYNNARKDQYYSKYGPVADPKIPTMATWDDHDAASDNKGNDYKCFKESQNEFVAHFSLPQSDPRHPAQGEQQQKGVYSANMFSRPAQFGGGNGVHAILLDARTARDPTFSTFGECKREKSQMLSDEQWSWFDNELSKESIIKIIASGTQVLPATDLITTNATSYCSYDGPNGTFHKAISAVGENELSRGTTHEKWSEIPLERAKLLQKCQKAIKDGKAKQIIFLSGDQHWAEIMAKRMPESPEFGPSVVLHEITASGIDQQWNETVHNVHRLKVRTADFRGNGVFDMECNFPFIYEGVEYNECTTTEDSKPWCSVETNAAKEHVEGKWGYCINKSQELIQEGQFSGKNTCTDQLSHICTAQANYGAVTVDWSSEKIKLSVFTPHDDISEAVSHTIAI